MTMQVLLSIVFGFGVLTLAAVALLNAAGQRLYELQVLDKRSRDFAFVYTYSSKPAADLRLSFSRLPLRLGRPPLLRCWSPMGCLSGLDQERRRPQCRPKEASTHLRQRSLLGP